MKLLKEIVLKNLGIIFIFLIWLVFSSPFFIHNKAPFPSTYLVNFFSPWTDYPGFSSPVKNNAMPDVITQIYPWKNLTIDFLKNFQIPLWNPYSFSGSPHLANYQSAVLSPFNILFFLFKFVDAWSLLILIQPLLAGVFMYLCLGSFGISKKSSVFGSISFMFCGFITAWMAYGTLAYAIIFLPLAIYAIEKFYKTQKSRFLILLSLTFPLSFFSGHFQISLYFLLTVILFTLFKLLTEKNRNNFILTLIYSFLGILLSLPQLLPSIELYNQTLRSGIFEKLEAIPFGYLPTFVAPDFFGNPVTRNDWFGHYAEWNSYIGLIPLIFSFFAVIRKTKRIVWFFLFLSVLSLLLSFSSPFLDLLILLKIPVISTSAASRIIILFSFSLSILSAFGLDLLKEDLEKKKYKKIYFSLGFFGIIFSLFWLMVFLKLFIPIEKILIVKQNLILPTLILLIFTILIFGLVFLTKKNNKKISLIIIFCIILLSAFDLLRFSNKWMPFEDKNLVYPSTPVVSEFNKISGAGSGRFLGNLGGEATNYYKLESIEGYDAVYIKRYGEFIASLDSGKLKESARSVVTFPKYGKNTEKALNLLNVKYIVQKVGDGHAPWAFPFWTYKEGIFTLLYNDSRFQVLQNNNAYPRAFLVNKYIAENDPQKIINKMFNKDFDLSKEVVLEKNINLNLNSTKGSTDIIKYTPNKIFVNTDTNGNALLFLSDNYYSGWEALVDGKKSEIYRADFAFRAVFIPEGKHSVEFIYNPLSFRVGILAAVFGLISILFAEVLRKKRIIFFPKT